MKRILLFSRDNSGACDYYRRILPYRFLHQQLLDRGIELRVSRDISILERYDAVVIYRHVVPDLLAHLIRRRADNTKWAYDTDDDFMSIPPDSPASISDMTKDQIIAIRIACDACFASTEPLARILSRYPNCLSQNVKILPNLMDLKAWGGGRPHPQETDRILLAFQGSNTHNGDLAIVEPAIARILKEFPQVDLVFFGDAPASWEFNWYSRIRLMGWCDNKDFPRVLSQAGIHIGICPLAQNQFNISKSCIKWAEYTLAGAVTVASPMPPYQIENDRAMLYATNADGWYEAIAKLVTDHQMRRDLHEEAHYRVKENWSWQHSPKKESWLGAFLALAGYQPGQQVKPPAQSEPAKENFVATT